MLRYVAMLVALVSGSAEAGEPHLHRIVAWDLEKKVVLLARWGGISQLDPPPTKPATNLSLVGADGTFVSVSCDGAAVSLRETSEKIEVKSCAPADLASRLPRLKLVTEGPRGDAATFRVERKDARVSATLQKTAHLQRRTAKGWVTVRELKSYAVPKVSRVVQGEHVTLVILELSIPREVFEIPSSTEEAVFLEVGSP